MRYLLLIVFLSQSIASYCQFFVGDSKKYVERVLETSKISFSKEKVTDSTNRITWSFTQDYQMILVLNADDIVIRQTLIPEKENGVNDIVKWFNRDFVIVSDTEWKNYERGRIYMIRLEHLLRDSFFSISLASK